MKIKKLSALLCAVCLLLGAVAFTGCGKQPAASGGDAADATVYKIAFSEYDWTETYLVYGECDGWSDYAPQVGDEVTISFDYCTTGATEMRFFNAYSLSTAAPQASKWTSNPDYWFEVLNKQGEKAHKGHFEWTFTAKAEDVQNADGSPRPLRWRWQQIDNSGGEEPKFADFYYWNFKITANGGTENMIKPETYKTSNDLESATDLSAATIKPEDFEEEVEIELDDIEVDLDEM